MPASWCYESGQLRESYMLISTDEPRPFKLTSATSVEEAVLLWHEDAGAAMYLAGGGDVIDMVKQHHATPSLLIDLKRIPDLSGISVGPESIIIGGLSTLRDIAGHTLIKRNLPALAKAASIVATPQIRNVGTIGGNLLQENRCPYYRGPWHCYRHGGLHCYAHHGFNREHAIFDGDRCYVVSPSDLAPVVVAADALVHVQGREGARVIQAQELFLTASENVTRMHSLAHGEVLTAVEFRAPPGGRWSDDETPVGSVKAAGNTHRSTFIKTAVRNSFDFALVNVAVFASWQSDTVVVFWVVGGAGAGRRAAPARGAR
jgi:xanthine dehydrogenase YagS FAD-binding subunit